jgi:hypothetical protein
MLSQEYNCRLISKYKAGRERIENCWGSEFESEYENFPIKASANSLDSACHVGVSGALFL